MWRPLLLNSVPARHTVPLYDCVCRACHHEFEALVRQNMADLRCPSCGSGTIERLPSTFAVNSAGTRQASLNKARSANLKVEKDKAIANEEYINKHHD